MMSKKRDPWLGVHTALAEDLSYCTHIRWLSAAWISTSGDVTLGSPQAPAFLCMSSLTPKHAERQRQRELRIIFFFFKKKKKAYQITENKYVDVVRGEIT